MKRHFLFVLAVIWVSVIPLSVFAQDAEATPEPITPPDDFTIQVALSRDGLYVAALTMDVQGETSLYVWETANTTHQIRLVPDLALFDSFSWSPNSQYIAVTGNRTNGSGHEFSVEVYDVLDTGYYPDSIMARPGRDFREFVAFEDPNPRSDYAPAWSADGNIIALNFLDGVHFYDLTTCADDCKPFYTLNIGYISSFDWQADTLITSDAKKIQIWDVSAVFQ